MAWRRPEEVTEEATRGTNRVNLIVEGSEASLKMNRPRQLTWLDFWASIHGGLHQH